MFVSSFPQEKPRNWTAGDYASLQRLGGVEGIGFNIDGSACLRADGVLGFSRHLGWLQFDPANRWRLDNGDLLLSWQNGAVTARFPIAKNSPRPGESNLALARQTQLRLVLGDYHKYSRKEVPAGHPEYARMQSLRLSQTCAEGSLVRSAAQSPDAPQMPTPAPERAPAPVTQVLASAKSPGDAALLGCWRWSNGAVIDIREDGTALNGDVRGHWRLGAEDRFTLDWPPIVDSLRLRPGANGFDGVGLFNFPFSATRVGEGQQLAGSWRRQDGVTLEFAADGTATAGPLRGSWRQAKTSGEYWVSWPLQDTIAVSADGNRLTVSNQFGKVSAKRAANCRR